MSMLGRFERRDGGQADRRAGDSQSDHHADVDPAGRTEAVPRAR
jgi:hypothetical protein